MQFHLKKLCVREDVRPLPSFSSLFAAAAGSQDESEPPPVDASMTLGGLLPLPHADLVATKTEEINIAAAADLNEVMVIKAEEIEDDVAAAAAADSNEIMTAFASLDTEAEALDGELPLEFRCRYRRGKCSQPRTRKKNGSMHSYCEHHRLLSVRNQRVFDQKRRRQRQSELGLEEDEHGQEQQLGAASTSEAEQAIPHGSKRPKRRRRTT